MTQPRKALIAIEDTPYYHVVSRCVRRAYLCGADPVSGQFYEHRRQWVEHRIHTSVRAKMHPTPETSEHTSIKQRILPTLNLSDAIQEQIHQGVLMHDEFPIKPLLHFDGNLVNTPQHGLPFLASDYLSLVDMTGWIVKENKRGFIDYTLPPILARLNLDDALWLENATAFERVYQARFSKRKRIKPKVA